jgi:hypothetical protein
MRYSADVVQFGASILLPNSLRKRKTKLTTTQRKIKTMQIKYLEFTDVG